MADAPVDLPIHTEEELRTAWAKCRNELWPDTFEETMKDPMRARMVDMAASGLANKRTPSTMPTGTLDAPFCRIHDAACSEVAASRRCANCPLRPPPRQPHHFKPPDGYVDRKRAAAGDRDED
jgi:hypothetical protein